MEQIGEGTNLHGRHGNRGSTISHMKQLLMFLVVSVFFYGAGQHSSVTQNFSTNQEPVNDYSHDVVKSLQNRIEPLQASSSSEQAVPCASDEKQSKMGETEHDAHTRQWDNWPAVAHEESGHPLVAKGDSFFNHARALYFHKDENGKTLMDKFLEIYKNRPDPINMCGIRINHAMALFLAVKQIKPSLVVESGVNAGVSTYFIRAASDTTKIFAIDPLEKPICGKKERWVDSSDKTTYYTGDNFVDLMDLDWKGMVSKKDIDPEKTLVFIDDHLHAFQRVAGVMKYGVRHIVVEDNYKLNEGENVLLLQIIP